MARSGGNSVKLIKKYRLFFNFVANCWDKRGKLVIRKVQMGFSDVLGTNWRKPLLTPGKLGLFHIFSPIFPPVPPKNWALPPS